MADDLDAELLALAGDASDEEASSPPRQKDASPSASPPHSPEGSSTMGRKGTAKPVRRGRKSRKDDEEDGEVYVQILSFFLFFSFLFFFFLFSSDRESDLGSYRGAILGLT